MFILLKFFKVFNKLKTLKKNYQNCMDFKLKKELKSILSAYDKILFSKDETVTIKKYRGSSKYNCFNDDTKLTKIKNNIIRILKENNIIIDIVSKEPKGSYLTVKFKII